MEATVRRKSIYLPADVLVNVAQRAGNPSPSGDTWFDDPENIQMIMKGKQQIEKGECTEHTAQELIQMLGV